MEFLFAILFSFGKVGEEPLFAEGRQNLKLVFGSFLFQTIQDELGNPFLWTELRGNIAIVCRLPSDKQLADE